MNENHLCNIIEKLQEVLQVVEGIEKVSFEAFDVLNPPENYEINIQLLPDTNDPLGGSTEYDGFTPPRKLPAVDRIERGVMVEIVKRGKNQFGIQNMAARCYKAIAESQEFAALVDSFHYEGSVPSNSDPDSTPFVSVALVFVFRYSTEAGLPGHRIHG